MPMMRLGETATRTPFHDFVCDGCGKRLASHFLYRPEKFADVRPGDKNGRAPDGVFYCHRDQLGKAKAYHQRALRRTIDRGYESVIQSERKSVLSGVA
jgi:hypothetical protein